MYLCICRAISDSHVRAAVTCGAKTVAQVFKSRETVPNCGKCFTAIREHLPAPRAGEEYAVAAE